jgi:hypothetical protein
MTCLALGWLDVKQRQSVKKSRVTNRFIGIGPTDTKYQLFNLINMSRSRTPELKFTFKNNGVFPAPAPPIRYRGFEVTYHADGATHFKAAGNYKAKGRKLPIERIRNPFVVFQVIVQKYRSLPKFTGEIDRQNLPIPLHVFEDGVQIDVYLHSDRIKGAKWIPALAPIPFFTPTSAITLNVPDWKLALTVLCHSIDPALRRLHEQHGENVVGIPPGLASYVPNGSGFGIKD